MAFTLEPVFELGRFHFHIPSYQRGYRWEKDQVVALLDDLRNFCESNPNSEEYYCLQPIVVVPVRPDMELLPTKEGESQLHKYSDGTEFLVIDGQQRLTTLFLLIEYLNSFFASLTKLPQYKLHFDKRGVQDSFMSQRVFSDVSDKTYQDNVDTFYLRKAWDAIDTWFKELSSEGNDGENVLSAFKSMLNKKRPNSCLDLRVIWYELPLKQADPIEEFDNLNYGSIRLTGTELVKSMLLASDGNNVHEVSSRGHAWDRMEKSLQDPLFWSMLKTAQNGERLSHIEFILDIVADDINRELPEDYRRKRDLDNDEFNYNVINQYFKLEKAKGDSSHSKVVKKVWKKIEKKFHCVRNWYDNPMWFHYIGLWRRLNDSQRIVDEIQKLENGSATKADFENKLRTKVGGILKRAAEGQLSEEEKKKGVHPLKAEKLNYKDKPKELLKILLSFNVMTLAYKSGQEQVRFPFHLYDEYDVNSLEHIYPQSMGEEMKSGQIKSLIKTYLTLGIHLDAKDKAELEELLSSAEWGDEDKALPEEFWSKLEPYVSQLEQGLSRKTGITRRDLHSIANMALVDTPTNAALSNLYLHQKREKLKERNKNRLEGLAGATYLMPATELVFAKHYTPASESTELRFWTKADRDAYLSELKNVYDTLIAD